MWCQLARRLAWSASDACAMRISSRIATLNPITEITNPARLIQSPTLMVIGSSILIVDKGRATFVLFLCDVTFCAGRDRRASAVRLPSVISQPPISRRSVLLNVRECRSSLCSFTLERR